MFKFRTKAPLALAAGAIAAGSFAGPAAAASPGDLCQVKSTLLFATVYTSYGYYHIPTDGYFRIESYGTTTTYIGHGSGQPTGSISRSSLDRCH